MVAPSSPQLEVKRLLEIMTLTPMTEADAFVGQSDELGTVNLFGGQVLAQAILAATQTVPSDRSIHSMHAYFLLPGEHAPVTYRVTRVRDGRNFTQRRVAALQGDRVIFELRASFHVRTEGPEHQAPMPSQPGPDGLASESSKRDAIRAILPAYFQDKPLGPRGIEQRRVHSIDMLNPVAREGDSAMWVRSMAPLPKDQALQRAILAYAADYGLLMSAVEPHGLSLIKGEVQLASLDHAMWFHRDFDLSEWLLFVMSSPSAGGGRGLCAGHFYTQDGVLVASVMQEGMVRTK